MARWITLPQAAQRLTKMLGRKICVHAILQLALKGHVQLGARIPDWQSSRKSRPAPSRYDMSAVATDSSQREVWKVATVLAKGLRKDDLHLGVTTYYHFRGSEVSETGLPHITIGDVHILESELPRIILITSGARPGPRDRRDLPIDYMPGWRPVTRGQIADLLPRSKRLAVPRSLHRTVKSGGQPPETDAAVARRWQHDYQQSVLKFNPRDDKAVARPWWVRLAPTPTSGAGLAPSSDQIPSAQASVAPRTSRIPSSPVVDEQRLDDGEPLLMPGLNKRARIEVWVEWAARQLLQAGDTTEQLATKIVDLAMKRQIKSERGSLTLGNVTMMLPAGITGKRGRRPGSQSAR